MEYIVKGAITTGTVLFWSSCVLPWYLSCPSYMCKEETCDLILCLCTRHVACCSWFLHGLVDNGCCTLQLEGFPKLVWFFCWKKGKKWVCELFHYVYFFDLVEQKK